MSVKAALTKQCKVCGATYESCFSCEKHRSWREHTDTAEHYFIFLTLMEYQSGRDAQKAYAALQKRNVQRSDAALFLQSAGDLVTEIFDRVCGDVEEATESESASVFYVGQECGD